MRRRQGWSTQEVCYCLQEKSMNLHNKYQRCLFKKQDETHTLWGLDTAACGNIVTIPL
jgi:hypothetical protein